MFWSDEYIYCYVIFLFEELEGNGFFGLNNFGLVKDILNVLKEWDFFEEIINFEILRGEYMKLIKKVIGVFDEFNDLEWIMFIVCRERILEERRGDVYDVLFLF